MSLVPRAEVLWRHLVFLLSNTINSGHLPREPSGTLKGRSWHTPRDFRCSVVSCAWVFQGILCISYSLQSFPCLNEPVPTKAGWILNIELLYLIFHSVTFFFFLRHFYFILSQCHDCGIWGDHEKLRNKKNVVDEGKGSSLLVLVSSVSFQAGGQDLHK